MIVKRLLVKDSRSPRTRSRRSTTWRAFSWTSSYDEYSGSTQITTRLDHISHGKTASATNCSNVWTHRVSIINIRRGYFVAQGILLIARAHPGASPQASSYT